MQPPTWQHEPLFDTVDDDRQSQLDVSRDVISLEPPVWPRSIQTDVNAPVVQDQLIPSTDALRTPAFDDFSDEDFQISIQPLTRVADPAQHSL